MDWKITPGNEVAYAYFMLDDNVVTKLSTGMIDRN